MKTDRKSIKFPPPSVMMMMFLPGNHDCKRRVHGSGPIRGVCIEGNALHRYWKLGLVKGRLV